MLMTFSAHQNHHKLLAFLLDRWRQKIEPVRCVDACQLCGVNVHSTSLNNEYWLAI